MFKKRTVGFLRLSFDYKMIKWQHFFRGFLQAKPFSFDRMGSNPV